jgi:hypothetical protein
VAVHRADHAAGDVRESDLPGGSAGGANALAV